MSWSTTVGKPKDSPLTICGIEINCTEKVVVDGQVNKHHYENSDWSCYIEWFM